MFNDVTTRGFDLLLAPFAQADPLYGLLFVSALAGIVLLKIFGWTSNQPRIRAVKNKIQAHILEIVLYRNQLALSMKAALKALAANCVYLKHALIPLAVMTIPCLAILAQLYIRYDHRPLRVGEETRLRVRLDPEVPLDQVNLTASEGLEVLLPPLRLKGEREVTWRVRALSDGSHSLLLAYSGRRFEKKLVVGNQPATLSPVRARHWASALLYPGEKRLALDGPVAEIRVQYPELQYSILNLHLNWIVIFLIISVATGMVFKNALGVQI